MGVTLSTKLVPDWQQACANQFDCSSPGLVDMHGQSVFCQPNITNATLDPNVWGITYAACQEKCGMDVIRQDFDFTGSAIPLMTWLLPWLGLVAQLPLQAVGRWRNLLSACTCIGSPALAVYSLALTASNRVYIDKKFKTLKAELRGLGGEYIYLAKRLDAIAFILKEAQQCPLRVNQRHSELSTLLLLDNSDAENFWKGAEKDLKNTRRNFTYSFAAQVFLAFIAYLFSFVTAVHDSLGSTTVAVHFASSTAWTWMFTIVFGYIRVGSQDKSGTIREALERGPNISLGNNCSPFQTALRPTADLYEPLPKISSTLPSTSTLNPNQPTDVLPNAPLHGSGHILLTPVRRSSAPFSTVGSGDDESVLLRRGDIDCPLPPVKSWGFDVRGEEIHEGPVFNYTRTLTWLALTRHIEHALATSIRKFRRGDSIPTTELEAAEICGFQPACQDLAAYISWSDISCLVFKRMIFSAAIAITLQWGSTGAAIFVAYNTPTVGVGCRSGSYIIYGTAATVSWLLLVFSSFCSHSMMQRLEKQPGRKAGLLGASAVITRILGNTFVILNTGWLIASTVLEEIGYFENCWCDTDSFQFGTTGWTPAFKGTSDLRSVAGGVWIGGFVLSAVISAITLGIFAFGPDSRVV